MNLLPLSALHYGNKRNRKDQGLWPAHLLPVFAATMFGGTLGGNATLIGASANVVAAGICASHGKQVSFATFLRYGVPLIVCQLLVSLLYVLGMFYLGS